MADTRTFDDRDGWIWIDGKLVPWREANVHVLTHALHYASSVFEGQRAYGGVIFKLNEHSTRLRRSAELLGFEIPWSVEQINAACDEVVKANGFTDAYVRPVAWLGSDDSADVSGRVFEVEGGIISLADGWQHGPQVDRGARWDPAAVGAAVRDLVRQAPAPTPVYGA